MSTGVREGDEAMQRLLDAVITRHQTELASILKQHGVKFYESQPDLP
jgi:hypothetical protein